MPVTYNEDNGKWCMGSNCNYDTKSDAEAAERAYYANMDKKKVENINLVKSLDEDKRIFTGIVLKSNAYDNDGINEDYWDECVVEQAAHDFMLKCQQGNASHFVNTDMIKFVESYIAPVAFEMGGGMVEKGDWVASVKILDDDLWALCKEGVFKGFSIGCGAIVEEEKE